MSHECDLFHANLYLSGVSANKSANDEGSHVFVTLDIYMDNAFWSATVIPQEESETGMASIYLESQRVEFEPLTKIPHLKMRIINEKPWYAYGRVMMVRIPNYGDSNY